MSSNKRSRGRGGRRNFNTNPNKQFRKQKPLGLKDKLTEEEVGITEYMNKELKGFVGIIKARYSDFHVNEIDVHNNVAKLTNTNIPEEFLEKKIEPLDPPIISPIAQISNDIWTNILKLKDEEENDEAMYILAPNKEDRTLIHTTIKRIFRQHVVSNTIKRDDNRYIELRKVSADRQQDKRFSWPVRGEYVHFLVYKEHIDTIQTAMKLANALKMKSSSFTYAGVKDRRAKTTQWFSAKKVNPVKLFFRVNKVHHNIKIGNVKFAESPLRLGDLNGNLFRIALRSVTADAQVINTCLENVKNNGFINYYGLQRFGADKYVPTHMVGIKLLQGNFKEACELILKVKECEDPDDGLTKAKKKYFETRDAKTALLYCDYASDNCIESKLLEGLAKCNPNDYVTALESIARNMRLLYIHAFQSFVWNNVTSRRIREFGLEPVLGDLVLISESKVKKHGAKDDEDNALADDDESIRIQEVALVTEDNISKYTIYDVVLPLPGFDIIYPENLKSYYQELLSEHGLCIEMPKQRVATYTLSGNYRHVIQRAANMTWTTLRYNDQNDTLIRSDFEEILKHEVPVDQPNGKHKAVIVSFELPSASYATMCLREGLRIDTSTAAHAHLMETLAEKDANAEGRDVVQRTEDVPQENSLLADKEKFEAFKRSIFGSSSEGDDGGFKRKLDDADDSEDCKKAKLADAEEKTVISMQASMP